MPDETNALPLERSPRRDELIDYIVRTVVAISDSDPLGLPELPPNITDAESWGMVCGVLEMIRHMAGWVGEPGDWFAPQVVSTDGSDVPAHLHLVSQVIAKHASGEFEDAMHLFYAAPEDVQIKANGELLMIAGGLAREKRGSR